MFAVNMAKLSSLDLYFDQSLNDNFKLLPIMSSKEQVLIISIHMRLYINKGHESHHPQSGFKK